MKQKNVIFLLVISILFTAFSQSLCFAENDNYVNVSGTYSVLSSPMIRTTGATVIFYGDNGHRFKTTAYEQNGLGEYSFSLPKGKYSIELIRNSYLKSTLDEVIVDNSDLHLDHGQLKAGDLNGDGIVNVKDIIVTHRNFASLMARLDLFGDGAFDMVDYNAVMENLGMKNLYSNHSNVTELLCDYMQSPLGIDAQNPYLSWKMNAKQRGQKQTGFRIVVSSSRENLENGIFDIWDYSAQSSQSGIYYNGTQLAPRTRYYWTVFVSDKDGEIIEPSTIAEFETGLFGDFGQDNKWISAGKYIISDTSGTIKANLTLTSGAVGVNFCHSEDGSKFLMWQVNVTSGKVMFRPHYCQNNVYRTISEKSIESIFPTVADIVGKPFEIELRINNGTVTTLINGENVHTYTNADFVNSITSLETRVAGSEVGKINSWQFIDSTGNVAYSESESEINPYAAPLFRKSFELDSQKTVKKARLYATAAGSHETYINGQRTGDDYLAPGKSEFNGALYYQTYDVTELLQAGENTLAAMIGMGWYNGGPIGSAYGTNIGFKAKLIITYDDGTEQVVDTDLSWSSTRKGPVITNRFYIGQYIDGRKNIDGWNKNGLSTATWADVKATDTIASIKNNFIGDNTNPIRAIRTVNPIEVTKPDENVYVYKFPANISATLRITASAPKDTEINLKYSEMLTGKGFANVIPFIVRPEIGDQNGQDKYIFAGLPEETFEFSLVYHGFQYVEISGLSQPIPLENITALVLSTDSTRTGYFECSNPLLNTFFDNVIRSQEGNFVGAITDCPTREKNNWTGDAQGFAYAATYNFNTFNIYRRFQEMTLMAQGDSGVIPQVVPTGGSKPAANTISPSGWSDTVILLPWQIYYQYGEKSILQDSFEAMKGWADFLIRTCAPYNYVRQVGWYGDNVAFDKTMCTQESMPEIGTAYSAYSIGILAKIAEILEKPQEAAYYQSESEKFAAAWRSNFLEQDGYTCKTNTQTSYAMGLYYDLYETPDKKQLAADKLAQLIINGDASKNIPPYSQSVGFIGYPILYYVLSQNNHLDTAFKMLEQTGYPSILYPVTQGATTTWERYDKVHSLNHFFPGCVASWFYSEILGITHEYDLDNVAYKHFILQPTYGGSLSYAKGSYNSQNGVIESAWELLDDGTFIYNCTVPANTTATIKLPMENQSATITEGGRDAKQCDGITFIGFEDNRAVFEVCSGVFEFVVK